MNHQKEVKTQNGNSFLKVSVISTEPNRTTGTFKGEWQWNDLEE